MTGQRVKWFEHRPSATSSSERFELRGTVVEWTILPNEEGTGMYSEGPRVTYYNAGAVVAADDGRFMFVRDYELAAITEETEIGRALTDMVDPIAIVRTAARSLDEDEQGDPATIGRLRSAAAQLNSQLVALRERYPHPRS